MGEQLESVEALHERYGGPLLLFALRRTGDRETAEEIVQDTLVRAWRHADRYDPAKGSVAAWLFTIARNLTVDNGRRRAARPRLVVRLDDVEVATDQDEFDRALEAWEVAEALSRLSPEHRNVLVEVYYRGATTAEAAERLGIPEGTVKSRTYYALRTLRVHLEELGAVR